MIRTYPDDPINPVGGSSYPHKDGGCLTKREYFAAMAMQGCLAFFKWGEAGRDAEDISLRACRFADALITELNRECK